MEYFEKDFGKILKNNAQQQRHELLPQGTDCFRVYDRNLSQFPVTVDVYGKYAKVTDFGENPMDEERRTVCLDICSRMLYLAGENVIYSYRAKRTGHEQHEKTGSSSPVVTTVTENGLRFRVDLTTYADTGLFLDHRKTREMIRERSAGRDVLNLFSYTGSFSVYAAAGLAKTVTGVDISNTYTNWAAENLSANGYEGDMYRCIASDALKFVSQAIKDNLKYDIIIFDPPCFSNSRKMDCDFDVARDYPQWIHSLSLILKKTGIILFSTNLGSFKMDRRRLRGLSVREITGAVLASGFVKDRPGTVRSWMMAFDDESLSLDWSEPQEKSVKSSDEKTEKRERSADRERGDRGERRSYPAGKPYGERKSYGDRKSYGERKSYGDRKPYGERRSWERSEDRDSRSDRKPYGERRSYGDRKPYGERKSYGERKPYGERRSDERSEDRDFYSERRSYGERRSYSDRPRFERSDRPYRSREEGSDRSERTQERTSYGERRFSDNRGERRSYDRDRKSYGDRHEGERRYSERRSFRDGQDGERKPYSERRSFDSRKNGSVKKPYGYDSFKPARSRNDSTDFFWNTEDLDKKKDKED